MAPLNPDAPEFYPKPRAQKTSQKPKSLHPHRPMFLNKQISSCPFDIKPGKLKQPHRFWFSNRKCLPPRLLKQKVWVHKNRDCSPRKPIRPPKEAELESLPSPQEARLESLPPLLEEVKPESLPHFGQEAKLESLPPREEAKLESLPPLLEEVKLESLPRPEEASLESLPLLLEEVKLESLFGDKTSVMIRNIPNRFGRKDLLRILDNHCRRENNEQQQTPSSYDFLYLPMDFVEHANLGYAFVNFTSSVAAERFRREYDNFVWTDFGYKKICEISVAKYQGKQECSQHFNDSRFPCHTDEYLPVILLPPSDGFTCYSLTTLGLRVSTRGGGPRRRSKVA